MGETFLTIMYKIFGAKIWENEVHSYSQARHAMPTMGSMKVCMNIAKFYLTQ